MVEVVITVDTELSSGRQAQGLPVEDNFRHSILGTTSGGDFGIIWQMDWLRARGLRGVYFVDPMPALVHGPEIIERLVSLILERGHEVQIHVHTEWLDWAKDSPVDGRRGQNVGDFSVEDQTRLIGWARDTLIAAGAPPPTAFRAGNFGANDDTLRALAILGIAWDTSYNAAYRNSACGISALPQIVDPVSICGVTEIPVAGIWDLPGRFRPAQICALSAWEMRDAMNHAADSGAHSFVIVTHSFEMLSRDRLRPNNTVIARFKSMCDAISKDSRLVSTGFAALSQPSQPPTLRDRLPPSRLRTAARIAEQTYCTLRYEHLGNPR